MSTVAAPATTTLTGRLGAHVGRHPLAVVVGWALLVAACFAASLGVVGPGLFASLGQGEPSVPGESHTAATLVADAAAGPAVLVRVDGVDLATPRTLAGGRALADAVAHVPGVASVASPFATPRGPADPAARPYLSATDPRAVLVVARLRTGLPKAEREEAADAVLRAARTSAARELPGTTVTAGGGVQLLARITHQVEQDLQTGEGIALPISLLVMVVVFGGLAAASMPIVGAIASIAGGLACLLGFAQVMDLDATVVNIVTILGLGLSIDYGLLVVSRYREELLAVAPHLRPAELDREHLVEATARTVASAGRTVLFSGLTVAISIAGMLVFPAPVIRAVSVAGVSVVLVAVASALTLVPALCRLAGRRLVRRGAAEGSDDGAFARLARLVQRHVAVTIVACTALLLLAAAPVLGMRQVSSSTALLPTDASERVFLDRVARDFPGTSEPTAVVVAQTTPARAGEWARTLTTLPGVTSVDPVTDLGGGHVSVGVRAAGAAPTNDEGAELVQTLRTHRPGFPTWVGGQSAKLVDYDTAIRHRAPYAVALVALATIVLLFLMTGSVALPLKALLFNLLSLGASLGAVVWIFQEGHAEDVLGFTSTGGVESVVPVILLAFAFGLSMDYEVFLLSRIVELHEQGASDADAVAVGVQRSGRIVTCAALLILIVLLGFAAARMVVVKQIGIGLAISIAVDATIVRMLLVPATMTLLGRWNWWAPAPLARWHEKHAIREH